MNGAGKMRIHFWDVYPEKAIRPRMNCRFQVYKYRITGIEVRRHVSFRGRLPEKVGHASSLPLSLLDDAA